MILRRSFHIRIKHVSPSLTVRREEWFGQSSDGPLFSLSDALCGLKQIPCREIVRPVDHRPPR